MIAEVGKPGLPARNREFLNRKLIRDGRGEAASATVERLQAGNTGLIAPCYKTKKTLASRGKFSFAPARLACRNRHVGDDESHGDRGFVIGTDRGACQFPEPGSRGKGRNSTPSSCSIRASSGVASP